LSVELRELRYDSTIVRGDEWHFSQNKIRGIDRKGEEQEINERKIK